MQIDLSNVLVEVAPLLNAASTDDADFLFWTQAELLMFADNAIQAVARKAVLFIATPDPIAFTAGQASAPLPSGAIAVVAASFDDVPLREANVAELEALDDAWDVRQGTPSRWLEDLGLGSIRLYPAPPVAGALSLTLQSFPPAVNVAQTFVEAPAPFAGFVLEAILAGARGRQSDAMMPEVSEHAGQRVAMYEQLFVGYYGAGG